MLDFELKGNVEDVCLFVEALSLFTLTESLGGIDSLISHPATMTHSSMSADA
jgi:cystathionine gamma-synthase